MKLIKVKLPATPNVLHPDLSIFLNSFSVESGTIYLSSAGIYLNPNKDEILYDIIMGEKIYFHPSTFRQPDYIFRSSLHQFLSQISVDSLLCIGGECYLFPRIVKCNKSYIISKYQSIIIDAKLNNPDSTISSDYFEVDVDMAIINLRSFQPELVDLNCSEIYLIVCLPHNLKKYLELFKYYQLEIIKLDGGEIYHLKNIVNS